MTFCVILYVTMAHAKMQLHWSVMHYQMTFEWHSGCGFERFIFNFEKKKFLRKTRKNYQLYIAIVI